MSEEGAKKLGFGAKAKSFFGGVKDALKDAATIELAFDNEQARIKGSVQTDGGAKELCIFAHDVRLRSSAFSPFAALLLFCDVLRFTPSSLWLSVLFCRRRWLEV